MSRTTRTAAALAAVAALGLAAPAASAAPHQHGGHSSVAHHQGGKHKPAKPAKLTQAQKKVAQQVDTLDRRLARVVGGSMLTRLPADERSQVTANVTADRAALAGLGSTAAAATSVADLAPVTRALRSVRPESYAAAVAALRQVARLDQRVADNTAALAAVDGDASDAVTANEAAATALAGAEAHALAVTASSSRADLRLLHVDLVTAHRALDLVEQLLGDDDEGDGGDDGDS
jgi:hypothetical protein